MFDLTGLQDNASKTITDSLSNVFTSFVSTTLERNGLVKSGAQPTGNLSQAQLNAGYSNQGLYINQNNPNVSGLMNSIGFVGSDGKTNWMIIGVVGLIVVAILWFAFIKK